MPEDKQIIDAARKYLSLRNPDDDVVNWDDERVLRTINRCYFGGIQRFVKYHQEKELNK